MDDQQPSPSDTPGYQAKRDAVAAHRMPPGAADETEALPAGDYDDGSDVIELTPEPTPDLAPEPAFDPPPEMPAPTPEPAEPIMGTTVEEPVEEVPPQPLADALPGDAAPTPLVAAPVVTPAVAPTPTETVTPNAVIIRPPAAPAPAAERAPRGGAYALWMLVWVALWGGVMSLTLDHRFDRTMDWNTSYFSVAARNLVREGFVNLRGGVYLNTGEFGIERTFYAGHPPLTAWLLAGWMTLVGRQSDAAIRALPLAFTAINLILLYALVRRMLGAPAALAATVICSLLPMTAYYAQVVNMEPFLLTFILGASLGYLGWARSGSKFGFFVLCVCVILGCWTDWPMYVFTGLLAVAHFFRRRDLMAPLPPAPGMPAGEPVRPGPPVVSALLLLVLPLAVFAAYMVYLKLNNSGFYELRARATERMTAAGGAAERSALGGYNELFGQIKNPAKLKEWFVGLFTPPALLLAALGALFWVKWSTRLATGEAARRAAFKLLLCLVLMQVIYTLAFPQGARVHEFWQYYLIVPVAVLAGAFCAWLTVAGGPARGFFAGLADRGAWAAAAMIPVFALGPITWRLRTNVPGKAASNGDVRLDYARAVRDNTRPSDVILTDVTEDKLGFALPWYTDRAIVPHVEGAEDTRTLAGIEALRDKYKGRRVLYLPGGTPGAPGPADDVLAKFPRQTMGTATVYVIGDAGPEKKTDAVPTPAATKPAPANKTTTRAVTKPAA